NPHFVPISGTTPHSCLGYVQAGLELAAQLREMDEIPDAIYTPFGTGGICAALTLGLRDQGITCPVIGISVNENTATCHENFRHWWRALTDLLGIPEETPGDIEIHDEFVGREYGDPTEACLDAILLLARTEAVLLDPVYSGKTFSGFLAHQAAGRWGATDRV